MPIGGVEMGVGGASPGRSTPTGCPRPDGPVLKTYVQET